MNRFSDFVAAIERIAVASGALRDRIAGLDDGRPLVPVVRSAVEHAADQLADIIARETPFRRPHDMIDEEWGQREIVLLRGAVATLELAAAQRAADFRDWVRDADLAASAFLRARDRFRDEVEM